MFIRPAFSLLKSFILAYRNDTLKEDSNGNFYEDVDNIRITLIEKELRNPDKNWAGTDTIRIQAYKGDETKALHLGAEIPIQNDGTFLKLIEGLCRLYRNK